jgi:hypothetical protein
LIGVLEIQQFPGPLSYGFFDRTRVSFRPAFHFSSARQNCAINRRVSLSTGPSPLVRGDFLISSLNIPMAATDREAVCLNPSSAVGGKCLDRNSSLTRSSFFSHQGIFLLGFGKMHTRIFPCIVRKFADFDKPSRNLFTSSYICGNISDGKTSGRLDRLPYMISLPWYKQGEK